MTDLAILVPSRGRPANVARLAEACEKTCRTGYLLHFGFDVDDEHTAASIDAISSRGQIHAWSVRERAGLVAWTNWLAGQHMDVSYLASLGDDMVPETDGWDEKLIAELEHVGAGVSYPDDKRRRDIPECFVISTPIVAALGWMMLPALSHWYPDNVLADICKPNGCLVFCPDVAIRHRHPNTDPATRTDATYHDAAREFNRDAAAYRRWRLGANGMGKDIATVRRVRDECLNLR